MNRTSEIKKQMRDLYNRVNYAIDTAADENRDLTAEEQRQVAEMADTFDALNQQLDKIDPLDSDRPTLKLKSQGTKSERNPIASQYAPRAGKQKGRPLFKNEATGETVYAYGRNDKFYDGHDFSIGSVISALVRNDFDGLDPQIKNAVTSGGTGGGQYLLTPTFSQQVIDLARAQSVVFAAGAQAIPMPSSEMHLLRVTSDPTTAWRRETAAVTASAPVFGRYTLHAKTCAAIVPISIEELEDAPNAGTLIESVLQAALGLAVDQAILTGSGAGEPQGITNNSSVNSVSSVATPTNYDETTTAIKHVLNANYPGQVSDLTWIMHPTIAAVYDSLKTGISNDQTPLQPTPWAAQLKRAYTTSLSADSSSPQNYPMIIGNFSEVLVGMRTSGVVIDVLDAGSVTDEDSVSWNAATQFMRFIRARIRMDAVLMRPNWFTHLSGVNA